MLFSMLYSGEQILSFKLCLVFYAGDSLRFRTDRAGYTVKVLTRLLLWRFYVGRNFSISYRTTVVICVFFLIQLF